MQPENSFQIQIETPLKMSTDRYPAEVRKLGMRAMQMFDGLQQSFVEQGQSWADAYFQAACRTPEMYKAEMRRSLSRLEPI
jgi:hypothetical protein